MIYQEMPRKGFEGCKQEEDKGFFIEGKDYADCFNQLKAWADAHPEKWIYYYDCGLGPARSTPVARHIFEVSFYEKEPASIMLFSKCFQKGCRGEREIDFMTADEKAELHKKHLLFYYTLGNAARRNRDKTSTCINNNKAKE